MGDPKHLLIDDTASDAQPFNQHDTYVLEDLYEANQLMQAPKGGRCLQVDATKACMYVCLKNLSWTSPCQTVGQCSAKASCMLLVSKYTALKVHPAM